MGRFSLSETNFTKLFSSITASTIWCESAETRVVWITMLAMADENGWVYASVPGLSNIAQVDIEDTKKALDKFLSPDEYSRDSANEGRRIEEIEGGWAILNHAKYRKLRNKEERRAYQREYMRKRRKSRKDVNSPVNNVSDCVPPCTQAEAEAETDKDNSPNGESGNSKSFPVPYQKIIDLYHECCPKFPRVVKLTEKRKKAIRARWKDDADNLEFWESYFKHAAMSKFLNGQNDRGWVADIDFLISERAVVGMQEGKYHGQIPRH